VGSGDGTGSVYDESRKPGKVGVFVAIESDSLGHRGQDRAFGCSVSVEFKTDQLDFGEGFAKSGLIGRLGETAIGCEPGCGDGDIRKPLCIVDRLDEAASILPSIPVFPGANRLSDDLPNLVSREAKPDRTGVAAMLDIFGRFW